MKEELTEKFDSLYAKMATSKNVEYMTLFGKVMKKMFSNLPSGVAEECVEELCAINWDNYLTRAEADRIVSEMSPQVPWGRDRFQTMLNDMEYEKEEPPYYNEHALYAAICMEYSDSSKTIAEKILKAKVGDVDSRELFSACYWLALDALKDKDGVFNIRKYFGL